MVERSRPFAAEVDKNCDVAKDVAYSRNDETVVHWNGHSIAILTVSDKDCNKGTSKYTSFHLAKN